MNLPPALSVLIIYNMHKGSCNLHKQCLHYCRHSVSLLPDQPTASAPFCMCHPFSLLVFSSVSVSWFTSLCTYTINVCHPPPVALKLHVRAGFDASLKTESYKTKTAVFPQIQTETDWPRPAWNRNNTNYRL